MFRVGSVFRLPLDARVEAGCFHVQCGGTVASAPLRGVLSGGATGSCHSGLQLLYRKEIVLADSDAVLFLAYNHGPSPR